MNSSKIHPPNCKLYCGICTKTIAKNHRNLKCILCSRNVHIKCNKTDVKTYNKIIIENQSICIQFSAGNKGIEIDTDILEEVYVTSPNLKTFFKEINQLNYFDQANKYNDDNTPPINCKYVD